uniref:Ubiquitin-like modifier-activating enzyme Atg7 N-terminal domain-containing protein n=1 Tax=Amphimedon queenslandica TaxID=400682 RepID=A0A1X7SRE1_AMPQE
SLDPGYWQELGKRKLEEYQLREDLVPIRGSYGKNYRNIRTPFLSLDYTAFDVGYQPTGLDFPSPGLLRNMNTIASFNNIDKKELLDTCGRLILESIKNGDCLKNPSLLTSFLLLMYAD